MAQRKSGPPASKKPSSASRTTAKTPSKAPGKAAVVKASAAVAPVGQPGGRPPAKKKPGKSIVNQKQTPWGLIITTAVIVVFAAAVVVAVVVTRKSSGSTSAAGNSVSSCTKMIGSNKSNTYLNELTCAKDIKGVTFKAEANRNHVTGVIKYDSTPPVGGNHNPYWADCTGTVYPEAIANENAVHMLEHGAVWITYNPDLPAADVATLSKLVSGQDRMAMSPYPDLKSPISLQAWGYQLFVNSPSDPRIKQFIGALRYNPLTTPEYGATCSQPTFKAHPSTFGHPSNG